MGGMTDHPLKGRKQNPEHVAKRARKCEPGCTCNRHKSSDRQKKAVSETTKRLWADGRFADRTEKSLATYHSRTPEQKAEESRLKSESQKRRWEPGGDLRENYTPPARRRVSNHEYGLAPYLAKLGYRHNHDGYTFIGRKVPDFVDIEGRRVFEYFGSFWHKPEEEQAIIAYYADKGWSCEVLWEQDLFKWLTSHKELVTEAEHNHAWRAALVNNGYRKPDPVGKVV